MMLVADRLRWNSFVFCEVLCLGNECIGMYGTVRPGVSCLLVAGSGPVEVLRSAPKFVSCKGVELTFDKNPEIQLNNKIVIMKKGCGEQLKLLAAAS